MAFSVSTRPRVMAIAFLATAACTAIPPQTAVAPATPASISEVYVPVPVDAAVRLGCIDGVAIRSPVCETAPPSDEEYSAFRTEAARLASHPSSSCRLLGHAVASSLPQVRMYRKALIKSMGSHRYYGVGHSYVLDDVWHVRVARNLDDLNNRTLAEMQRTLRHEVSHTIGAAEDPGAGWTADNYARNCA